MALSRGGDQAVIKNRFNFEFFGGHSAEVEKRTKVKSRVMANAFGELVSDASAVFIMGHKYTDLDSMGAAAGICCIARKRGKRAYIVLDYDTNLAETLANRLRQYSEYKSVFISAQDALLIADSKSPAGRRRHKQAGAGGIRDPATLVQPCRRYRPPPRSQPNIENATLNYHEALRLLGLKLVAEMLQYLVDPADILRIEAEALLAGIVLDTKSFAIRTGSRTFSAAAYLRRCGADTTEVSACFSPTSIRLWLNLPHP
jgi:c-di-AMP phosphodiesterase-like protein